MLWLNTIQSYHHTVSGGQKSRNGITGFYANSPDEVEFKMTTGLLSHLELGSFSKLIQVLAGCSSL